MRKLKKIAAIFAAAAMVFSTAACSNQSKNTGENGEPMYRIGIAQYADHPSLDNCRTGFLEGLKEEGFEVGKNLEITEKSAMADDALNIQIAQTFANEKMDLVCGIATPTAMALYNTCYEQKIPVIFNAVSDPIAANLAKSETEPMEGITGVSDALPVDEQLKLIREMLPDAKKIGIIYTTSEENSVSTIELYKEKVGEYGFTLVEKGIANAAEIPQAADQLVNEVDCISNMTDNTVVNSLPVILEKALAKRIPVFGSEEEQVGNGCLASAGIDYIDLGKRAGKIAARVLKGESVSSIPFETIGESKITYNPAVAQTLGLIVPDSIVSRAETK